MPNVGTYHAVADREYTAAESLALHHCRWCGKVLDPPYSQSVNAAEIHHVNSRGMSGSRRDDRIVSEGKRQLETRCGTCHHRVNARPQWNQQEKEKQP